MVSTFAVYQGWTGVLYPFASAPCNDDLDYCHLLAGVPLTLVIVLLGTGVLVLE